MMENVMGKMLVGVLTSAGINAESVMGKIVETQNTVMAWINHFNGKFDAIDQSNKELTQKVNAIYDWIRLQEGTDHVPTMHVNENSTEVNYIEKE